MRVGTAPAGNLWQDEARNGNPRFLRARHIGVHDSQMKR